MLSINSLFIAQNLLLCKLFSVAKLIIRFI